jgi:guanylate kinase
MMTDLPKTVLFTAPSGAGKTTIVKHLLDKYPEKLAFSVSATTRKKRRNETDGKDYYFLSKDQFMQKVDADEFIEWEEVYAGQYYGTLKSEIDRLWQQGKVVIFDIDVIGATTIKRYFEANCLAVFVSPPDIDTLINRLKMRGTETPESLEKRITRMKDEMQYRDRFDLVLINDDRQKALAEADEIVQRMIFDL